MSTGGDGENTERGTSVESEISQASCEPSCKGKKSGSRSHSRKGSSERGHKKSLFQTICEQEGSKRKRRKRGSSGRVKKSCKPGMKTRNPFFNFLRDFRQKHCGWGAIQVAVEGAKEWNSMSDEQKIPYVKIACKAKPFKRRKRKSNGSRSRSRSRGKRTRTRSRSRGSRGRSSRT